MAFIRAFEAFKSDGARILRGKIAIYIYISIKIIPKNSFENKVLSQICAFNIKRGEMKRKFRIIAQKIRVGHVGSRFLFTFLSNFGDKFRF